jgi:hypothetical protein
MKLILCSLLLFTACSLAADIATVHFQSEDRQTQARRLPL